MSESEAIPVASRLRNQNEILIEKSDEALVKTKIQKTQNSSRMSRFIRDGAIQLKAKFA